MQAAVFVAFQANVMYVPAFHTRAIVVVAVPAPAPPAATGVVVVERTNAGDEVGTTNFATVDHRETFAGADDEVVPTVSVRVANAAPEYAVKLVPIDAHPTRTFVTYRSFESLFRIELEVAVPVAGTLTIPANFAVLNVVFTGDALATVFVTYVVFSF